MMQRLREQTSSPDPVTARAAMLLSAMPPLEVDRLPLPAMRARKRPGAHRVRMMLVLAISLGSVAAAAAATLHRVGWLGARGGESSAVASPHPQLAPATRPRLPDHGLGSTVAEAASTTLEPVETVAPAAPARAAVTPTSLRSVAQAASHKAASESSPGGAVGAGQNESGLIVNAVRALRRDGDPARAQALAEEALKRYPHGIQVEEAMALVMEAASAQGDVAGARRAAEKYLERFGGGRFADRAQRLLAR